MVGAVGIELKATLKTRKLLILLNEKNAKNTRFAQPRYTPGTRTSNDFPGAEMNGRGEDMATDRNVSYVQYSVGVLTSFLGQQIYPDLFVLLALRAIFPESVTRILDGLNLATADLCDLLVG
jgi:hypothetical protein